MIVFTSHPAQLRAQRVIKKNTSPHRRGCARCGEGDTVNGISVHIVVRSQELSEPPNDISSAPCWSKPLKARRSLTRQAPPHYLHTINISLHVCQVVIYRASVSSLCHSIWPRWLIYLCSSHMPLSEGHFISTQMLSISCTFALWRFSLGLLSGLICPFFLVYRGSPSAGSIG